MLKVTLFKISQLGISDKEYHKLPFGRQLEYAKRIQEFKSKAKTNHVSIKRKHYKRALKEFIDLYNVNEYWCSFSLQDDSFEIYYTTNS